MANFKSICKLENHMPPIFRYWHDTFLPPPLPPAGRGEGGGALSILLGTDVPLGFSKHPPFIYSIFLKNTVTCFYIYMYFYQFKNSISMYSFFYPCGPKLANEIFYSI
jgi:hypothetical protein